VIDVTERQNALLATAAGTAGVAGSYLVAGWSPAFVVRPVDQLIVNATPGAIVTFMIWTAVLLGGAASNPGVSTRFQA